MTLKVITEEFCECLKNCAHNIKVIASFRNLFFECQQNPPSKQ